MIGLDLNGCVHKKWVKIRNKGHFTTNLWYFLFCHVICNFVIFKFSTGSQNGEFQIHVIWMKIGLSEMVCLVCLEAHGVYVLVLGTFLFPSTGFRTQALSSEYKLT